MSVTATRKLPEADRRKTCSNCNHVGHLAPTCEREEGSIDKIGIEIEGFWTDLHSTQRIALEKGWPQGNSDGSLMARDGGCDECNGVHACTCDYCQDSHTDNNLCAYEHECQCNMCECESDCACYAPPARGTAAANAPACSPWEFQTKPGTLGEQIRALQILYPDFTNSTAGMHVHLSFREEGHAAAMALGNTKFFTYWAERWDAWGKRTGVKGQFWKRLKGENKYSSPNTMDDWNNGESSLIKTKDRRRQINFQAWSEHKTVEFRLLPMFRDAKVAISAVCELVSIVEDWLLMADSNFDISKSSDKQDTPLLVTESYALDIDMEKPVAANTVRVVHVMSAIRKEGVHIIPRVMVDAKVKAMVTNGLRGT